jgi:hypothetical protein
VLYKLAQTTHCRDYCIHVFQARLDHTSQSLLVSSPTPSTSFLEPTFCALPETRNQGARACSQVSRCRSSNYIIEQDALPFPNARLLSFPHPAQQRISPAYTRTYSNATAPSRRPSPRVTYFGQNHLEESGVSFRWQPELGSHTWGLFGFEGSSDSGLTYITCRKEGIG